MTADARTANRPRPTWWRQWPLRAGRVSLLWAIAYAGFGLACALTETRVFPSGDALGPSAPGWAVMSVGTSAALTCAAVTRHGARPASRALLWALCALSALGAFGLLMDLITLTFGQGVDSRAAAAHHVLAATGALLLAATARADRRPPVVTYVRPPATAAARSVQLTACAGTVAFVPYVVMKQVWVFGGTFAGTSGAEMLAISERNGASGIWLTLESRGLDATVLLAALGVFLLWGLVRPWGQVFPRWAPFLRGRRVPRRLPLTPALIGAATLAPYGVFGLGYLTLATTGVVTMRRGDFPSPADALLVAWIGMIAFAAYGIALAVAARSYWSRTRPLPAAAPTGRLRRAAPPDGPLPYQAP
ncbi:hypothetical protein [Streptomyces pactum]|uniref:hypothetical protein n=1 Tax=Streptomyces pactum TaxID=68249 RepID=UPI000B0D841C|nr:hypothetical protein [Streptomyces pactum]